MDCEATTHAGAGSVGDAPLHAFERSADVMPTESATGVMVLPPAVTGVVSMSVCHSAGVSVHITVDGSERVGTTLLVRATVPIALTVARRPPAASVVPSIASVVRTLMATDASWP